MTANNTSKKNVDLPQTAVAWKTEPDQHDYPAAENYLSLLTAPTQATDLAKKLQTAPIAMFKAKDILRAAGLALLPLDNPHVLLDLGKVVIGEKLSPVLLIRGDVQRGVPAQIADGYHRVCASYHLSENTDIPARVIDLP